MEVLSSVLTPLSPERPDALGKSAQSEQFSAQLSSARQASAASNQGALGAAPHPGRVAATRTQLSPEQAAEALSQAWQEKFGSPPSENTLSILTAQWSHETADGASMYNFNFGGIKGQGPSGLSVMQRTREGWGSSEVTIRDQFRAYQNKEEGAGDYLSLLGRRFPGALQAAAEGQAQGFVHELKKGGYFTGDETAYTQSIAKRSSQLLQSGRLAAVSATSGEGLGGSTVATSLLPSGSALSATPLGSSPEQVSVVPHRSSGAREGQRGAANPGLHSDRSSAPTQHLAQAEQLLNQQRLQSMDDALAHAALRIALSTETSGDKRGLF